MRVFITGGTGFVGTALIKKLTQTGHEVTILTRVIRDNRTLPRGAAFLEGDPVERGSWQDKVPDHDVVMNLAGASIFTRWTTPAKKGIRESRLKTTEHLVEALAARKGKETLLVSTSAVGYYGFHGDVEIDEGNPSGDGFLATLAREWESVALKAQDYGVRLVLARFGVVLGKAGGALGQMVPVFRKYLGSPLGNGEQWFSWIHEEDLAHIHLFLLDQRNISGPINCTAPNPVRNKELTKVLGEVLGKPTFMPAVPGFMVKLVLGEFGSVLLKGQKVLPKKLLKWGFRFQFPEIRDALKDLLV